MPSINESTLNAGQGRSASPTRVLHVINGEHYAGAERVQDLLAQRLPELGFEVGWACVKPKKFPTLRHAQQTPLVETPMRGKLDLRPVRALVGLIRRDGYQLIHTHSPRAALVGRLASAWTGLPLVHHVHGQTAIEVDRSWNFRVSAWVERRTLRGADAVIAVSPSAAAYMSSQRGAPRRVVVVPNGVPAQGPLERRCRPGERWTLGMVAMFRPRKGAEDLLHAVARLRREGLDVVIRAVGGFESPAYQSELQDLAMRLGLSRSIAWTGFSSDVPAELKQIDVLALPSVLCEGMPMVVLEAMAAGVPVIGTRVDGITDVIRDRQTGLLVNPGDPADLARSIRGLITGAVDWRILRRLAHEEHALRYSDVRMAEGVADVYRDVLAARGRAKRERVEKEEREPCTSATV